MVTSTTSKKQVTLTTGTDAVATGIHVQSADQIKVIRTRAGEPTTLTGSGSDYSVTDVGVGAGCTVTFVGQTIGDYMTIKRNVDLLQSADYVANNQFDPEVNEDGHDKARMIAQQFSEELGRCFKFPETEVETSGADEIAARSARLTTFFGFDAVGDPKYYTIDEAIALFTGLGTGSKTYSVGAGGSVALCISGTIVTNRSVQVTVHGVVDALGSHRRREYFVTNVGGTVYVSNVDNVLAGKSGAEDVDFTAGAIGALFYLTLDGSALTSTQNVSVNVSVKNIKSYTDFTYTFA